MFRRAFSSRSLQGPNNKIIDLLNHHKHLEQDSPVRNAFKIRAFQAAIDVITQLDYPIKSIDEAKKLKGIGPGITRRIEEYLSGESHMTPEARLQSAIRRSSLETLQLVSGIGPTTARKLVDAGCTDIPSLRTPQYSQMLKNPQKIALKYHGHLQIPIKREESENILEFIRDHISSKFQVQLGGSYRRGAATSSDIDVILFHPSHVHIPTPPTPSTPSPSRGRKTVPFTEPKSGKVSKAAVETSMLVQDVIRPLEERGMIVATLGLGMRKWQGIILMPHRGENGDRWEERRVRLDMIQKGKGAYRRMDVNLVPTKSSGAALLALTGDVEFNKDIRTRAIERGLHLNEFGLWRWQGENGGDGEEGEKGYWEMVKAETEEEILKELDMTWIEPEKRNFAFLVKKGNGKGQGKRGPDKQKRTTGPRKKGAT